MNKPLLILVGLAALLQAQSKGPEFEVASIRPAAPITQAVNAGMRMDGAQVNWAQLTLRDYIAAAYKVKDYQIQGPDWMASARFDITAKLPSGVRQEQVPEMLGALLADRFLMKLHRESKEFPVYGLVVGKGGPKLKASPADPPADSTETGKGAVSVGATGSNGTTFVDLGKGSSVLLGNNRIEAKKVAMPGFADMLARFTDRPTVDMTGLRGNYDLTLEFSPEDFRAMMIRASGIAGVIPPTEVLRLLEATPGDTTLSALETLGLKLEPRKAPLDVLVIDHMERTPSDN
jgi:uncharacterized protein (TIGR03435 family)